MGFRIEGLENLQQRLRQAGGENLRLELTRALRLSALAVHREASHNVSGGHPLYRQTGTLASSIREEVDSGHLEARIGTNVVYGPVHEYGAVIRPKVAQALRFPVGTRGAKRPDPETWDGPWATVKSVTIPARPWLGPALDSARERIIELFREALQRVLGGR